MSHPLEPFDLAELELEQELRQMFELDSQKDLETYLACVDNLQDTSWKADIQQMYRAIHTIKGGSVTVKADAILNVATVLEDLLSELRYLETVPSLSDGQLQEMLLEGGEIIASVFNSQDDNVQSKVERIQVLQQHIHQSYLQDWNEKAPIQIEFAEQGFDLVVLELEIALDNLSQGDRVPEIIIEQAAHLIEDLSEIGRELELESGWETLLQEAAQLLDQPEGNLWKTQWHKYFNALKASAKAGGKIVEPASTAVKDISTPIQPPQDDLLEEMEATRDMLDLGEIDSLIDSIELLENEAAEDNQDAVNSFSDLSLEEIDSISPQDISVEEPAPEPEPKNAEPATPGKIDTPEDIIIPIPLSRLDKSANSIVDTLIASRTTEKFYTDLHQDLIKLVNLAKDNVQYITQLRQLQDDYALLENIDRQVSHDAQSPTPERYRAGYITINRLLENSLRLAELGTEVEQTAKQTADKLQLLNNHVDRLKDVVEDSRLVPFKNLSFRVKAILRDLSSRYDKPVQLKVTGEEIELDVGTAKRLEPILLHLVRNAFDHGLESPAERLALNKPEKGAMTLNLQRYGSSYVLSLQDDGKGIDRQKITDKAIARQFPLSNTDTPEQLLAVICQPGFSSKGEVSNVSGRGVGMDVVTEQISLLDGFLDLDTTLGAGTTFKIHFPVPHLLVPCLLVQAGDRNFAIPTDQVVMTELWDNLAAAKINRSDLQYTWEITQDGVAAPGLDLLGYWDTRFRQRSLNSDNIGIYIRSQSDQLPMWLLVDKLLGKLELKIQPIPQPLTPPPGIMGVSLQADSSLIPVLELGALSKYLRSNTAAFETATTLEQDSNNDSSAPKKQSSTILIVDDAALIRRRIEASLNAYGYTTHTCSDGLEAWNWLQTNPHPAMVITDVEMPNMDGFTLIEHCRQNDWDFPILVISSRLASEWGQEASRLGGTDFLTKGFSSSELIAKIQQYY